LFYRANFSFDNSSSRFLIWNLYNSYLFINIFLHLFLDFLFLYFYIFIFSSLYSFLKRSFAEFFSSLIDDNYRGTNLLICNIYICLKKMILELIETFFLCDAQKVSEKFVCRDDQWLLVNVHKSQDERLLYAACEKNLFPFPRKDECMIASIIMIVLLTNRERRN